MRYLIKLVHAVNALCRSRVFETNEGVWTAFARYQAMKVDGHICFVSYRTSKTLTT
jgi:hypothetical protein